MNQVQIQLHEASELGDVEMVDKLLDAGVDPNIPDEKYEWTILHKATLHSHYVLLKYLIEKVNINIYSMDSESQIPFHLSSKDIIIRYYVEDANVSINYTDQNNESLIMKLIKKNNFLMVQYIIEQYRDTINLNLQTERDKNSVLHISILKNNFQVFLVLLEHRKVLKNEEEREIIEVEDDDDDDEIDDESNENSKVDIYMQNKYGYNILHLSIIKQRFDFVKEILRRFRNDHKLLNMLDGFGNTPIFYSIETKRVDVIQWCIDAGCDYKTVLDRQNRSLTVKTAQLLRSDICSDTNLWMNNPYVDILNYFLQLKVDPYPKGCRDNVITSSILHSTVRNMFFTEKLQKDQEIFMLRSKVNELTSQVEEKINDIGELKLKMIEDEEEKSNLRLKLLEEEDSHIEARRNLEDSKNEEIMKLKEYIHRKEMEHDEQIEILTQQLTKVRRDRAEEVEGMDREAKKMDRRVRSLEVELLQKKEENYRIGRRYSKRERKWKNELRNLGIEKEKQEKKFQETKQKLAQFFETL